MPRKYEYKKAAQVDKNNVDAAIEAVKSGVPVRTAATTYNVARSTIRNRLKRANERSKENTPQNHQVDLADFDCL